MPRWTAEDLRAYEQKRNQAGSKRSGPRTVVQEQKDDHARQVDHRSKEASVDGEGGSRYRVTITLLVSDRRSRDGDGAISTLLDTYLVAVGRLLGLDRRALRKLAASEERRGGRRD